MNGARWLCLLLWTAAAFGAGAGDARLFFSRTFPGSAPPYMEVRVAATGDAEYREAPDEELPLKFKLADEETAAVFALAEKLDYFRHPLESPAKVAFMGTKLLRYESGDGKGEVKSEVKFNYSEDASAQTLLDWFERMAESAELRIDLERAAKYDHLGVMHALETLEGRWKATAWWPPASSCRCWTASPTAKPTCTPRGRWQRIWQGRFGVRRSRASGMA